MTTTVKELKKFLEDFPEDFNVLVQGRSLDLSRCICEPVKKLNLIARKGIHDAEY